MDFCTQLSINLLIDVLKANDHKTNSIFSPLSYNVILNMTAGAASGNTLMEMLEFLQCAEIEEVNSNSAKLMSLASKPDESNSRGPAMHCLNGIWLDQRYQIKASYEELVGKIYKAPVKIADFENQADELVEDANKWAKESTKGLVTNVLERGALDHATVVLGNALYFKGNWRSGFEPESTLRRPFYLMNGEKKSVPFMKGCTNYFHRSFDGFEIVRIPYQEGNKGEKFSMYIFLPEKRFGLEDLLHKVTLDEAFLRRDFDLPRRSSYDSIWIPKFKFSYYSSQGVEGMKKMGLESPFTSGLSEMINGEINVSRIVQKSFIEVDEKGTEAASVTFAECAMLSRRELKKFIADHPFMFMIREEKSKFILFTGVVLDPTSA